MPTIRSIAVGLPVRAGHVLLLDGVDRRTGAQFHRAIGGGIEFCETSERALRREFMEELSVSLGEVRLLGVIENLFEFEEQPGHEIVFVYAVESEGIDAIGLDEQREVLDTGSPVRWVPVSQREAPFYPEGIAAMLTTLAS